MPSIKKIQSLLERADQLYSELKTEYEACLHKKEVSDQALNLTHEITEKCSNALDQVMYYAWKTRIEHKLEVKREKGHFPAAKDENSYRSTLGQWGMTDLDRLDSIFDKVLRSYQPMTDKKNNWLADLKLLSANKHRTLIPQKKVEQQRRTTVSSENGSVSWMSGVTFSPGVEIMGAPINSTTQRPFPNKSVETSIEIWVGFNIQDTNLDSLLFIRHAIDGTREIINDFASTLSLT